MNKSKPCFATMTDSQLKTAHNEFRNKMNKLIESDASKYKEERLKTAEGGLYESLYMDRIYQRTKMTGLQLETEDKAATLQKVFDKQEGKAWRWRMATGRNGIEVTRASEVVTITVR